MSDNMIFENPKIQMPKFNFEFSEEKVKEDNVANIVFIDSKNRKNRKKKSKLF